MELIRTSLISDPYLAAYYRFEGNGNDYTGSYNMTSSNVVFGTAEGRYYQGGSFNGNNSGMVIGSVITTGTTNIALCAWAYLPNTSTRGDFIKIGTSGGYGIGVGSATMDNNGNQLLAIYETSRWIAPAVNIGTGWHHVVLNIGSTGNPQIFLDGTFVYSDNSGGPVVPSGTSTIGYNYDNSRYVTGYLDDIAVFTRTLTQPEITLLAAPSVSTGVWLGKYMGA